MIEPKRLHEMDLDSRTRRIIAAGLEDSPPLERIERIASGIAEGTVVLGATVAVAQVTGGAGAAPLVSASLIAKWLSIGVAGGILFSLGLSQLAGIDGSAHPPTDDGASQSPAVLAGPTTFDAHERAAANLDARPEALQKAALGEARSAATSGVRASKAAATPSDSRLRTGAAPSAAAFPPISALEASALREEVALIAKAKAAFDRGAPAEALALLKTYRSRFPNGRLEPEASAIELEANVALGSRAQASEIARRLAAGSGPSAVRARQLLEGGLQ